MNRQQLDFIENALSTGEPDALRQALEIVRAYRKKPEAPSCMTDSVHPLVRHFPRGLGLYGYKAHCLTCALLWTEQPVNQLLEGAFPACERCGSRDVQRAALTIAHLYADMLKPAPISPE